VSAERDERSDLAPFDDVVAEIDAEVRRRRASGDLPARLERDLDELFLAYSPMGGHHGGMEDALRMVDAATFVDPVVPVASAKSGGALVKRTVRQLTLWYVGYVTHQVNQFATASNRALHIMAEQVDALRRAVELQALPPAPVVTAEWAQRAGAWWMAPALSALSDAPGRVLHAAAGDGWLVHTLSARGIDSYGVDPRPRAGHDATGELREEGVLDHLRAVSSGALGGIVLTGVVEALAPGERRVLLEAISDGLAPGGCLVVHSLSRREWEGPDAPLEADLAPGRPLRPETWRRLLGDDGFIVTTHDGPEGRDYVVIATSAEAPAPA
jgi:hypothetical protein